MQKIDMLTRAKLLAKIPASHGLAAHLKWGDHSVVAYTVGKWRATEFEKDTP